ncbi:MAG: succinylglutamate-semialdehyde dehydrogenase [Acidimicrobiia bacterium]|nr:succinylglutamate-semialdehyde dehydrogenase [Acidimicrobiia bacterium]
MTDHACLIDGSWTSGSGPVLTSTSPVDGAELWSAPEATADDVASAISSARSAQPAWEATALEHRSGVLTAFAHALGAERKTLADAISLETGKPQWEADTEVASVIGKVALSIEAHAQQNPDVSIGDVASLAHRPVGVVGVLGPFNFPAHLANGQIIPALLAGNSVVYKPSDLTPLVATIHVRLLLDAGVPAGVVNLVVGGREAGEALVAGDVDAIGFTGSVATGRAIHRSLADRPEVLLALEMGGNNPLVVADVPDQDAVVNLIIRSAFITAGQRCTCARRIYIPRGHEGDRLLDQLIDTSMALRVGAPDDEPEPFMGPLITSAAADRVRAHVSELVARGGTELTHYHDESTGAFVRPTIVAADRVELDDDEVFGPVITVQRFGDLESAFASAADTRYGLAAGLVSSDPTNFDRFKRVIKAGIVNFNCPTTGASGRLPFGGVGASGNHRPAGWTAADFCAYPVATMAYHDPTESAAPIRGLGD